VPFFIDPAKQSTVGGRGKTTRRKSTRTVRGSEGAWVALMKEQLSRPRVVLVVYCELMCVRNGVVSRRVHQYGHFESIAHIARVMHHAQHGMHLGTSRNVPVIYSSHYWFTTETV